MTNPPPDREAPYARWLRERLAERRMTLAEMAEAIGVAAPTVSHWANGRRAPREAHRAAIEAALAATPVVDDGAAVWTPGRAMFAAHGQDAADGWDRLSWAARRPWERRAARYEAFREALARGEYPDG